MRKLIIKRKKNFVGVLIKYWWVVDGNIDECRKKFSDKNYRCKGKFYPIAANDIAEISIKEDEIRIFILAETSTGLVFSEEEVIKSGKEDVKYEIITKYNWLRGSKYVLRRC